MSPRAWAARALLDLSGHVGALGPVLAAATARAAEALADAALWASPLAECPGCGAAVPALALVGVEVCGECAEREAVAPPSPIDVRGLAWPRARHRDTDPSNTKPN